MVVVNSMLEDWMIRLGGRLTLNEASTDLCWTSKTLKQTKLMMHNSIIIKINVNDVD